eukprot:scaffold12828_cov112-Isochrysis_galbana.AAC.3
MSATKSSRCGTAGGSAATKGGQCCLRNAWRSRMARSCASSSNLGARCRLIMDERRWSSCLETVADGSGGTTAPGVAAMMARDSLSISVSSWGKAAASGTAASEGSSTNIEWRARFAEAAAST